MAEQLELFPRVPNLDADVESLVQRILSLRIKYNASGQKGEDVHLIRAALATN
ncbi:hypothetical protein [Stenotrophomonas maltophilia]|uniref:hypothetical protein n=1 Tax=Stenotrophomonas maltophilia TaxID=40324 RepID=UPI0014325E55|nr:hypothetical protein [Stenotrophomonas maltophilia]